MKLPENDILFIVPRYWPSDGVCEVYIREYIQRIKGRYKVGVIRHCSTEPQVAEVAIAQGETLKLYNDAGVPVYHMGVPDDHKSAIERHGANFATSAFSRTLYRKSLRKAVYLQMQSLARDFRVIHAVMNGLPASVEIAASIARESKKPFLLTPIPFENGNGSSVTGGIFRKLLKHTRVVIATSDFEKNWLTGKGVAQERIHVCPPWPLLSDKYDAAGFRAHHNLGKDPVVLFSGVQKKIRGYQHLCIAADHVWAESPETRFVFIGPTTEESRVFFTRFPDRRIVNLGEVSQDEKTSALAASDVVCVPSNGEGLGNAYLEAWAMGKPVIASDSSHMRNLIENGRDGILVEQDYLAITDAILSLVKSPALRSEIGEAGQEKVRKYFDDVAMVNRFENLYVSLLSR